MPYVSYDPVVDSFRNVAYEHGWVKKNFARSVWMQSDEARSLRDGTAIRSATSDQLGQLLTVCIRQDRFVEGALMGAFESGLIPAHCRTRRCTCRGSLTASQSDNRLP